MIAQAPARSQVRMRIVHIFMIPSHDSGKQITVSRIPASILQRDGSILSGTANRVPPTISPKDRVSGVHGEAGWSLRSCSCWRPRQMPICSQWLPKVISGSARHLCLSRILRSRADSVPGRCVGPKPASKMATRSTSVRAPDSNGERKRRTAHPPWTGQCSHHRRKPCAGERRYWRGADLNRTRTALASITARPGTDHPATGRAPRSRGAGLPPDTPGAEYIRSSF